MNSYNGCLSRDSRFLDLEGKTAVFIGPDWSASLQKTPEAEAEIFYCGPEQTYCFTPLKNRVFFLRSGQPLGANRQYHLRRGTALYQESVNSEPAVLL